MSENWKLRSKEHIFRLIANRNGTTPNFALLIGSGASAKSGVKTSCEMIREWRKQLYSQSKVNEPFEEWLKIHEKIEHARK